MEFVQIPLRIAQRAARVYRPMLPYVRKYIVEQRKITVVDPLQIQDLSDFVVSEYEKLLIVLNSQTVEELLEFAKSKGLKKLKGLDKEALIKRILE